MLTVYTHLAIAQRRTEDYHEPAGFQYYISCTLVMVGLYSQEVHDLV